MKTKLIKFHNSSYSITKNILIEVPFLCPHCGVSNNPITSYLSSYQYELGKHLLALNHKCTGCEKNTFSLQMIENGSVSLLNCYPDTIKTSFDNLIVNMSPRFVELYKQASAAEQFNHIDLAGMGYRASLEILIKDYALYFELDSKEEISKLNLNRVIGKYFKSEESIIPADVVRKLGNDYAHWEKEHEGLPLEILKKYLDIFVKQIEVKLMLKHPPVPTRSPQLQ
ncbi:DUF4145 domain-containing protein [Sutcliffiella cohnii]